MRKPLTAIVAFFLLAVVVGTGCGNPQNEAATAPESKVSYAGYESPEAWGEHLIRVGGCGDCHTPKKMGPNGPVHDSSLLLSGHPAQMPPPPVDQKESAAKGLVITQTLTAWVGPWGTSYAGNITPDSTGIGGWKEEQFFKVLREGKFKGLDGGRPIMPPMPIEVTVHFTDNEIKAMFAYLKSIKPVKNVVPAYQPPAQ